MELVRADKRGRTRYSPEYRQQVLEAFESSGQTAMAFAEHVGVKYSTFASWVSKANRTSRKRPAKEPNASPSFVLTELAHEGPSAGLVVVLPGGSEVRASTHEEIALLAELLKTLA